MHALPSKRKSSRPITRSSQNATSLLYLSFLHPLAHLSFIQSHRWCCHCGEAQLPKDEVVLECVACKGWTCLKHDLPALIEKQIDAGGILRKRLGEFCCSLGRKQTDEAMDLIKSQLKACPNCQLEFSRDGGCRHMRCPRCSHEFMWCCLKAYRVREEYKWHLQNCPDETH